MTGSQYPVYVGSYAPAHQSGIHAFRFDAASGDLTADWSFAGITDPSFLALHPNGRWLYAVSEMSQQKDGRSGEVWALHLPDGSSSPQPLNHQPGGGDWPCHLLIDAAGRWLLVSNYGSGSVGVLPILEHGALGAMTDRSAQPLTQVAVPGASFVHFAPPHRKTPFNRRYIGMSLRDTINHERRAFLSEEAASASALH